MAGTGFFTKASEIQHSKQAASLHYIDLLALGETLLPALAVAFLDGLKSTPTMNETSLKKIVKSFFSCYPQYKPQQPSLTATETMNMLVNTLRTSEMVNCISSVFQHLAADQIYARPLHLPYREAFDNLSQDTDYDFLRQPGTLIPDSVLAAALYDSLGITQVYSFIEQGQELRERVLITHPTKDIQKSEWNIQVQKGKYFPGIQPKNKTDFAYVGQLAINPPKLAEKPKDKSGTVEETLELIKTDNARLLQIYTKWRKNLLTMIHNQELTTSDLMDLYIEFLPSNHSSSKFFFKLPKSTNQPVNTEPLKNSKEQMNELLANSLATWISTNQIQVDSLFEKLENSFNTAYKKP